MKIKFESNYGNFDYRLEADAPDGGSEYLMRQGLANIAYRVAGSSVDKALGAKDRKSVEFSDEDAERINAAVSKKISELEEKENGALKALRLSFAVVGAHEFGAEKGEPTKEAKVLWAAVQLFEPEKFQKAVGKLGIKDANDDAEAIAACQKHLLEAKRAAAQAAKDALSV